MVAARRFFSALFALFLLVLGGFQSGAVLAATTPTSDFIVNGDGSTVTHKTTGLTWKRCVEGQTWSGSTCAGVAQRIGWYTAMALGVNKGWGLPTKDQLLAIEETGHFAGEPVVNQTVFPNTPADYTWSASETSPFFATLVNFYIAGKIWDSSKEGSGYYVRLVQGGQILDPSATTSNYTINGDGSTVTNKTTGLTWKRCAEGQTWTGSTCGGTAQLYSWATAMSLGANGWGLPTKDQLVTTVDTGRATPYLNPTVFPNPACCWYWSASESAADPASAWYVDVGYGANVNVYGKPYQMAVRLVQGGPSVALVSLVGVTLTCPSIINSGTKGLCSATANYSDGTSKSLDNEINLIAWSTSNATLLNLSGPRLTAGLATSDTVVTISLKFTDNGVTKAGVANITVKAAGPLMTDLKASCPSTIDAGTSAPCTATASYSDGSSKVVSASWSSPVARTTLDIDSNTGILTAGNGSFNADTPVTISVFYVETTVFKSASTTVIVKPLAQVLTGLTATCTASTIQAGENAVCYATAAYNNGRFSGVTPNWTSSNAAVLSVGSGGKLVVGTPATDTVVTLSATYSEAGVSKSATITVTVKPAALVLTTLTVICPNTPMNAGSYGSCSATATYSDGSSRAVSPTWASMNITALVVNSSTGSLTAGKPYADTVVIISAGFSEGGVTKYTNVSVTVKAAPVLLFGLRATCQNTLNAGSSAVCSAIADYNDGSSTAVTANWVSSNPTALSVNGSTGSIVAGKPTADTVVTLSVSYSEGGVSKSANATVTVKATAAPTPLSSPTIAVTPASTAAPGTKMTISFSPVPNATWYKLCLGSMPGNYSNCGAVTSPSSFTMGKGNDFYMALKSVNGQGESSYSNELHLKAAPDALTSLQAPVISISPSATAAPKTPMSINLPAVQNATSYKLCTGKTAGNYTKCLPWTFPFNFTMPPGMDYFLSVKAVNGTVESGYSNELHVTSEQLGPRYVDAIVFPNSGNSIVSAQRNVVLWNKELITGNTVDIYYLKGSSVGIGSTPDWSVINGKLRVQIAKSQPNTGAFDFQYTGAKSKPRIIVVASSGAWSISKPTASQVETPVRVATPVDNDPKIYMTVDKSYYVKSDPMIISLATKIGANTQQSNYDLRLAVYPKNQPNDFYNYDGKSFKKNVEAIWPLWAGNTTTPEVPNWIPIELGFVWNGGTANEDYKFVVTLEDKTLGSVASANFTATYLGDVGVSGFKALSQADNRPELQGGPELGYIAGSIVDQADALKKEWAKDKIRTLGKATAWGYNLFTKNDVFEKVNEYVDVVKDLQDDFDSYEEDDDLRPYADNLLAMNMMLKLLELTQTGGYKVPSKELMDGAKKYFSAVSLNSKAVAGISGSINVSVEVNDDCFLRRCSSGLKAKLTLTPIDVCNGEMGNQGFGDCTKKTRDSPESIINSIIPSKQSEVTIDASDSIATFVDVPLGWHLVEVRRSDNDKVVHRETIFVDRSGVTHNVRVTNAAIKATKY